MRDALLFFGFTFNVILLVVNGVHVPEIVDADSFVLVEVTLFNQSLDGLLGKLGTHLEQKLAKVFDADFTILVLIEM